MVRKYFTLLLALGLLLPTVFVFAKGEFDYLTIKGPGIIGTINVTDPALTQDFFAFADFTKGEIPAPTDPGQGYQVLRVYVEVVDSKPKEQAFDLLHYYPYSGYVYYDGVAEGSSEYVGKWYVANPAAETPFRSVLFQNGLLAWVPFGILVIILAGFLIAYYRKPKE